MMRADEMSLNTKGRRSIVFYCPQCEGAPAVLKFETVEEVPAGRQGLIMSSDVGGTVNIKCQNGHTLQPVVLLPKAEVSI